MKINKFITNSGSVRETIDCSDDDKELKKYYEVFHTYEIPEKKECEHNLQYMTNPPKCKNCGMVLVVYNEPIINPHMNKEELEKECPSVKYAPSLELIEHCRKTENALRRAIKALDEIRHITIQV